MVNTRARAVPLSVRLLVEPAMTLNSNTVVGSLSIYTLYTSCYGIIVCCSKASAVVINVYALLGWALPPLFVLSTCS